MVNFCEACNPPRKVRYEGRKLILERVSCGCPCPTTILYPDRPRCERCGHQVMIELTDGWVDPYLWIDPTTRNPVRVSDLLSLKHKASG